ncbi:DUS12 phosphatase, partial [Polyodon spathula]|nr:DUS12 phosphatase [Polyodon spathula]
MICVQSRVHVGGASDLTDYQNLTDAAIIHVLTVDSEEPEVHGSFQGNFFYVLDESSSDLLSILDDCIQFITEALATTPAAVLVHCHAGVSRSAAVVTAFMMKTHSLNLSDAYAKLQNIKPDVKLPFKLRSEIGNLGVILLVKTYFFIGPKLWNRLPVSVREVPAVAVFKTQLKTFF